MNIYTYINEKRLNQQECDTTTYFIHSMENNIIPEKKNGRTSFPMIDSFVCVCVFLG